MVTRCHMPPRQESSNGQSARQGRQVNVAGNVSTVGPAFYMLMEQQVIDGPRKYEKRQGRW